MANDKILNKKKLSPEEWEEVLRAANIGSHKRTSDIYTSLLKKPEIRGELTMSEINKLCIELASQKRYTIFKTKDGQEICLLITISSCGSQYLSCRPRLTF